MTQKKIYGYTLLAGLMVGSGCFSAGDDPPGMGGTDGGSDGGDDDDDEDGDGSGDGSDGSDGSSGSGGTSGSSGEDGGSSSGSTSGDDGDDDGGDDGPPDVCNPGIPETTQLPRMKNAHYDMVIRDLLGMETVDGVAPSQVAPLADDFSGEMTQIAWNGYNNSAQEIAAAAMADPSAREHFITCDPAADGCLEETIENFGRKAFRRPLTSEEVSSFMRLTTEVDPVGTPEEHAEAILYAFLASPSFIYIPELHDEDMEDGAYVLSSYEVAARLSFLLWGSIPDDELNEAADNDELQTKEQILEQAERMLGIEEKAAPMIAALHRHYAVAPSPHWGQRDHSDPLFSPEIKGLSMQAQDAFFQDVVFSGGSFDDLLLSDVAYVNEVTAPIYGLDAADFGPELERVTLDGMERPGFLTRIAFLSSFAHDESTSPALRGAFISQHVIGAVVNPPPPGAADAEAPDANYQTEREYVEALTSPDDCAGCHLAVINPPGYVLENYDAIGAWQDEDPRGGDIDPVASVAFPGGIKEVSSAFEMMEELASNEGAREKYVQKMVEFATGRLQNANDTCTVEAINMNLGNGYTILDAVVDLTQTDSFRLREAAE